MRCQVWITKVSDERTNGRVETVLLMVSKWESGFCSQISRGGTCLRPRWHPAYSWHERGLGFCVERVVVAGRKWTIWQGKNEHFCHSVVTPLPFYHSLLSCAVWSDKKDLWS